MFGQVDASVQAAGRRNTFSSIFLRSRQGRFIVTAPAYLPKLDRSRPGSRNTNCQDIYCEGLPPIFHLLFIALKTKELPHPLPILPPLPRSQSTISYFPYRKYARPFRATTPPLSRKNQIRQDFSEPLIILFSGSLAPILPPTVRL